MASAASVIRVASDSSLAIGMSPLAEPLLTSRDPLDDAQGRMLYIAFLVLGVGSVLPTFVLGAAVDYFTSVSPDGTLVFELNAWFNGTLFLLSVFNALYLTRLGFTMRIVWGFVTMGICMGAFPLLDQMRGWGPAWVGRYETAVLAVAAGLGVGDAFSQCSLYGLSSAVFPPIFTQALLMGVSICGTLMTTTRIAIKWFYGNGDHSSYAFFSFAAAYSFGCAALYWYVRRRNKLFHARLDAAIETSPTLAIRAYATSPKGSVRKPRKEEYFAAQVTDLLFYSPQYRVGEACFLLICVHVQFTMVVPSSRPQEGGEPTGLQLAPEFSTITTMTHVDGPSHAPPSLCLLQPTT